MIYYFHSERIPLYLLTVFAKNERADLLAVKFLREMKNYQIDDASGPWPWSIKAMFRPVSTEQDNVMLRYIDAMQGNCAVLAGFCSAITDYIGCCETGGGTPYPSVYEKLTEKDIKGGSEEWPTLDREGNKTTVRVSEWNDARKSVQKLLSDALPNGNPAL